MIDDTVYKIAIAGYLHDIGKFAERAHTQKEKSNELEAEVLTGLERIGEYGFGKDASSGLGKFVLGEENEMDIKDMGSDSPNACYTLSPCVPENDTYSDIFFMPFTRYGKHGDVLAKSDNPFKNPVIMADEGAILMPKSKDVFNKLYIGQAVVNVSKAEPKTVVQGYSLYIPVSVEV